MILQEGLGVAGNNVFLEEIKNESSGWSGCSER